MGAANPVNPQDEPSSKPTDGSILLWLAKDGPRWARIPAICAGLLVAVVPALVLFVNALKAMKSGAAEAPAAAQLQMGATAKFTAEQADFKEKLNKALNPEDREKILLQLGAEIDHEIGHLSNPVDQAAKWTIFEKRSAKDYWGYKRFPSDGCLLIARVQGDYSGSQWLRDPEYHTNDHAFKMSITPDVRATNSVFVRDLHPAVYHPLVDGSRLQAFFQQQGSLQLQEVQAGCLNPHPGQFQQSWGAYINQCQQPTYRRWADGCFQAQIYDHCQNVWGPIVWQFCAARHF